MNIVILEDEAIMVMFLKDTLEQRKHKVKAIFNKVDGLMEFLKDEKIDLIFVDILVEGFMDGIQIAKKIREKNKDIKIVFITSYKDKETLQEAKEAKPDGYLIKPITQEHLDAILMICESSMEKKYIKDSNITYISNYSFHHIDKVVKKDNKSLPLSNKEIQCFEILLKNKGTYISREILITSIWIEINEETKKSLRELLHRLRKKLPDIKIHNLKNIGYTLSEKID